MIYFINSGYIYINIILMRELNKNFNHYSKQIFTTIKYIDIHTLSKKLYLFEFKILYYKRGKDLY